MTRARRRRGGPGTKAPTKGRAKTLERVETNPRNGSKRGAANQNAVSMTKGRARRARGQRDKRPEVPSRRARVQTPKTRGHQTRNQMCIQVSLLKSPKSHKVQLQGPVAVVILRPPSRLLMTNLGICRWRRRHPCMPNPLKVSNTSPYMFIPPAQFCLVCTSKPHLGCTYCRPASPPPKKNVLYFGEKAGRGIINCGDKATAELIKSLIPKIVGPDGTTFKGWYRWESVDTLVTVIIEDKALLEYERLEPMLRLSNGLKHDDLSGFKIHRYSNTTLRRVTFGAHGETLERLKQIKATRGKLYLGFLCCRMVISGQNQQQPQEQQQKNPAVMHWSCHRAHFRNQWREFKPPLNLSHQALCPPPGLNRLSILPTSTAALTVNV